ncbi:MULTISPECIES: radical SAM family heme chaperone HemW [unclassified Pedobacter]|uniref:radical SAM family heme chaperone HemW n=1 Tax=unclassified Pedobacter TaxID=2628915 RepID=UPI0014213C2A|nr:MULTISPECIES: radical SAM family heme chaperone HemW [unclassified Pedobacter]NII85842.1 oxygen-independent coproporphyrinogen-3 oxidase [Pedobacter sp. SG908]NMN39244.1 oxygen-independent coproporphyrinogen-3 oxidase [Pedobacter sp. SG918]
MSGIYIHIPFCKKACHYCDFHFSTSLKYADEMVDAICKEIKMKKDRISGQVGSIYFGGGTPSILSQTALQKIFDAINHTFSVDANAEITIETNPDDLTAQKLKELKQLPVNRFSVGIQSFYDEDLIWMNRAHQAQEAEDGIRRSQDAGFENLTLDLIYGYPLLTDQKWLNNIQKAIELEVPHISAYALTVEPRTALAHAIKNKKQTPVNDNQSAAQFVILMEKLMDAGFEHYEISNFAKPDHYAVHNTNYWKGIDYIGIGPSAHGFNGQNRYMNPANNAMYMETLGHNKLPEIVEELSLNDRFNEYIMTSLRTMWGTDLQKINTDFGKDFLTETKHNLKNFEDKDWLVADGDNICLSQNGKLFADHIASELFIIEND